MDANICAASRALMDWDMASYRETHDERISSSLQQHSQSDESQPHVHSSSSPPSSSPSSSSESESYPLSRCSSISSLSSAYSDSDTSDTEDCGDNALFLISILKKPRLLRGSKQQQQQQQQQGCERQMSHHQHNYNNINNNTNHSGNNKGNNSYAGNNANGLKEEYVTETEDDGDEWQDLDDLDEDEDDDESECEIVFERNVTFDDPLATDIITGVPVAPSSRSRVEWTALKARERLERRLGFLGAFEEEEGEEGDDNMSPQDILEERHDGEAEESKRGTETRGIPDDNDDDDIEAYVLNITEAATQFVDLERIQRTMSLRGE
ncbi:hypothetical protein FHL15_007976 [Xylaria flabelliformis]|uniref:Uncharacterized protein n=1 Tax=Xylaria flabelliformis TaxID=2512241 RepID=A0A553HTA5_9PEZI|nr:hypothetical protein FHL15_007976 [Xylaria flabelliformis]